jgi:hypothetical protein
MRCNIEWPQGGGDPKSRVVELIEETKDGRELKRALSVKMVQSGMAATQVGELLQMTP